MRYLSLFSGGGGGDLSSQHLQGWQCYGYVEWEEYCQQLLAQRQKEGNLDKAPIFGDIDSFIKSGTAEQYKGVVDVVTAGFPCQSFSVAGSRKADADARNKWPATLSCLEIIQPKYAFLENVNGLLSAKATEVEIEDELVRTNARSIRYLAIILRDLAAIGYDARYEIISASDVGAPHQRKRWWCVAERREKGGVNWPTPTATDDTERSADNIVLNSNGTPRYKTRKGSLSQARLPESVKAFEGGINIPTPRANDCKKSQNCNPFDPRNGLQGFVNVINNNEMFPTPVSSDGTTGHIIGENDTFKILDSGAIRKINQKGTDGSIGLGRYVRLFPTPQQSDWKGANLSGGKSQSANGLATAVLKFPTPRSSEYKDSGPVGSKSHTHMIKKSYLCAKVKEKSLPSGKLNPDWVCWLMGWPIGWADKEPLPKEAVKDWRKKTLAGLWWQEEPKGIPRVKTYSGEKGIDKPNARRANAVKALGNGQVPLTAFVAKQVLFTW